MDLFSLLQFKFCAHLFSRRWKSNILSNARTSAWKQTTFIYSQKHQAGDEHYLQDPDNTCACFCDPSPLVDWRSSDNAAANPTLLTSLSRTSSSSETRSAFSSLGLKPNRREQEMENTEDAGEQNRTRNQAYGNVPEAFTQSSLDI